MKSKNQNLYPKPRAKPKTDRDLLNHIVNLLEGTAEGRNVVGELRIYTNAQLQKLLGVGEHYLRKLRNGGYLAYSHYGDKYWYTQEDVDKFLKRFHYRDYSTQSSLPEF